MTTIKIETIGKKPKLKNPILVEGLPGIGNVGKVAVDFIVEEIKAKKLFEIYSHTFPHSVFVNEDNLVELPKVEIYYKQGKRDILFLAGDIQPIDEVSSYEFSEKILDILEEFNGKEVITLGGIGLSEVPKKPKIYCTGNSKKTVAKYKDKNVNHKLYGVVGPIVGVSGLLLGLAQKRKIDAVSFLAETYAHPMYLGMQGAKEILKLLNSKLGLKIDMKKMDEEIQEIEKDLMKRTEELNDVVKQTAIKKLQGKLGEEVNYIG
ncbi:MAG: PAC2 family protein [Candidatus Woesearchaeota archaeon]|jgi:hypothetical protein|nr:PAC2 family protein [Candidatus Woesearchaeota archaeon]